MKRFFHLPAIIALTIFCSCQKQQTEEERNAEVERQVQQRLAAEHQAEEQQRLAQRESELDAREKALASKQAATPREAPTRTPFVSTARRMLSASGADAAASYSTFYTKLEPHGLWRESSTYGYVWQPREAQESRSWRPYTNGHWVYTDAGWTWVSDEPFGWATYHYGRWTRLRNIGWVWVPGDEWAPAWVSWRKSNDYVGWAPLPPEARFERNSGIHNWADNYYDIGPDQYCFVPTTELGAQRVERVVVPAERNLTIVNQTTNVTNITYNNTTIVNQGPNYDELRARTQQPIPRLRLERQTKFSIDVENPRPVVRGEVIEMAAPAIAVPQAMERPRSVKETIAQTVVDHGWETITDHQATEKARVKMRAEATPPADAPSKVFVKPVQARAEGATPATSASPSATSTALATEAVPASPTSTVAPPPRVPPRSRQTLDATASVTPTGSPPFRHGTPMRPQATATATVTPASAPMSTASVTPGPRETVTITPQPTLNPRAADPNANVPRGSPSPTPTKVGSPKPSPSESITPKASATASVSPTVSPTVSGSTSTFSTLERSAESKDQRKAQKESRKEEKAAERQRNKDEFQKAKNRPPEISPGGSATTAPSVLPSVSASTSDVSAREEKKQRTRGRERNAETRESASPSPSAAPQ